MRSEKLILSLHIYFDLLTQKQRLKISEMGYSHVLLEQITMEDFKKITKSRKAIDKMVELKRMFIRAVA